MGCFADPRDGTTCMEHNRHVGNCASIFQDALNALQKKYDHELTAFLCSREREEKLRQELSDCRSRADSAESQAKELRIQMLKMCPTSVIDCRLPSCRACCGPECPTASPICLHAFSHYRCDNCGIELASIHGLGVNLGHGLCAQCGKSHVLSDNCP